ncbi:hypothetical protein ACFVT5_24655 [Streptomyces sp. NPDC058001]|uniref:hypothetical protein n=1 Tax=Streptomyces sp. NPDC058001 TaxID=3346300 RepID=UPI0036F081B2
MAGRRQGRRTAVLWLVLAAIGAALVGCGGPAAPDTATGEIQRLLDLRARAVLALDEAGYRATGDPSTATGAPAPGGDTFRNLRAIPLSSWAYRVTDVHRSGTRATADADLSYRIAGYDRAPVVTPRTLDLRERDGRWYVTGERPAKKAGQQLWDQGEVGVARGTHSLVLGIGQDDARLRGFAGLADRAVPQVSAAWGKDWAGQVVVLVPKSLDAMAGLLGAPAAGYRGIAAVTTGEAGGSAQAPADRIIVNPDAYGVLGDFGKQVVLTHESTHVATRARTSAATPLWLSEGYADWVGYRDTGRTPAQAAPELEAAVVAGRVPAALPNDGDFGFSRDADALAQAYEGGWLACLMIAEQWSESELNAFYRAVGAQRKRAGAVETALRDVLGTTPERFTERWQRYLRTRLG